MKTTALKSNYFNGEFSALLKQVAVKKQPTDIKLSNREKELLQFFANGMTTVDVSAKIFLTPNTINSHRKNIIKKMNAHNITHAVAIALRKKLIK